MIAPSWFSLVRRNTGRGIFAPKIRVFFEKTLNSAMSPSLRNLRYGRKTGQENRSKTTIKFERVILSEHERNGDLVRGSSEEFLIGEFDPGSERTLAAWIRHASRTGAAMLQWRKGEEHVNNLPSSWD